MNRKNFVQAILFQLDRVQRCYDLYIKNKVYLHAKCIYHANLELHRLLNLYCYLLLENEKELALELIIHIDVWMEQFNDLEKESLPKLETQFVFKRFSNTPEFPKMFKKLFI